MNTYICIICYDEDDQFSEVDVMYASSEWQAREKAGNRLGFCRYINTVIEMKGVITELEVL